MVQDPGARGQRRLLDDVEVFLQGYLPESVAPYREAISLSIPPTPGRSLVKRPDNAHPTRH